MLPAAFTAAQHFLRQPLRILQVVIGLESARRRIRLAAAAVVSLEKHGVNEAQSTAGGSSLPMN